VTKLRIATRKSNLALVQTRWVAARIREHAPDLEIEEVTVVTQGDVILDKPLMTIGGKGLFVSEVEACIVDGRADIAVHSMKDVPGELAEGLFMVCIPEREDPRDVLVSKEGVEIDALPAGAKVGTSSLRRSSQLKAHRPDLAFTTLRGNVETRLRKLDEGHYAAIVLAAAGLRRLGYDRDRKHWVIPPDVSIPAVGQGALGIEARVDDERVRALLAPLEHRKTRIEIEAERAFLSKLEGSCKVPIAAHAELSADGSRLTMHGMVGSLDGAKILSGASDCYLKGSPDTHAGEARTLGTEIADGLIAKGAKDLIREAIAAVERAQKQGNGGGGPGFGKWK
jgi:hydroxymethylbilane synthase